LSASLLAGVSIAIGLALLIAVYSFKEQTHRTFTQAGLGVDAVLGSKGSSLQIVLSSLFHLESMPGTVKWTYFKAVSEHPLVSLAIPFVAGHSYGGFRVNAIAPEFFTKFEYLPGRNFSFRGGGQGRLFEKPDEAVAGSEAARILGLKIGNVFNPVCGVKADDPVHKHDHMRFVGIMAPTGTAHDRAIYIPLTTFYGLGGHGPETARMANQVEFREISGAYLKIRRIREGAIHPGMQGLKFEINQSERNQLVIPSEVLPRLFDIIGWVDRVLMAIAAILTVLAGMFLLVSLLAALRERRRDLALLRCLGATRRTVFGLVVTEAVLISVLGGIAGLVFGHLLVFIGAHRIKAETGVHFAWTYLSAADWGLLPAAVILGFLAGLVPAIQAYRLGVLKNLEMIS
jgi:putative ABC transport system permease protein